MIDRIGGGGYHERESRSRAPEAQQAMALVLFFFTLFSIAVFGMIALFARSVRARTPPNERRDLEENSIIREEWEWVRRARCGPDRCPRAVGSPLRPRGDVVCEICAAVFMERNWRRLVGLAPEEEPAGVLPIVDGGRLPEPVSASRAAPSESRPEPLPMLDPSAWAHPSQPAPPSRRTRLTLRLGFALALGGASVLALSTALIPGYFLVACGIGMLLRSGLGRGG
jgi:hypothetical protein